MTIAIVDINSPSLNRYLVSSRNASCPKDQVKNFLSGAYVAQPKQLLFHAACREADKMIGSTPEIAFGGARGPGTSHAVMAQLGLDDCQRRPGLKCLFLRKIQKSTLESMEDLSQRVLHSVPYNQTREKIEFPNGSRILTGGYNNDRDIDRYIGIEYDVIAVEEVTMLTEQKKSKLMGSCRTSRDDWKARMYYSTNPGGPGHLWFKTQFVLPTRDNIVMPTRRFFQALWKDNKFLKQEYIEWLKGLKGLLGLAWREGNWDAFEGMAFPGYDARLHEIDDFPVPEWWPKWLGVDWGSTKPFSAHWYTKYPDNGRIFCYREAYQAGLTDVQQARVIRDNTPSNEIMYVRYADPSMWAKNKSRENEIYSTADVYEKEGVILTPGDNDRLAGKRKVERLLGNLADGKPGIQFFKSCVNMIRTLPALPTNPIDSANPEDVDTNAEDHAYDDLRMALTDYESIDYIEETAPIPYEMELLNEII